MVASPERSDSEREERREPPSRDEEQSRPSAAAHEGGAGPETYKVFVGGISWHMNDSELLKSTYKGLNG